MKKKMKSKLITAVMSLAMVFTMMPMMETPVYADDTASEPLYAVLDSKDGSLTFKREVGTYTDGQEVGTLTYYTVDEDFEYAFNKRPSWLAKAKDIKKVDFQTVVVPKSCSCWFDYCENLKEVINADRLKTSRVTSMRLMFDGCTSLVSLDVSGWDTGSVEMMRGMFYNCSKLDFLDLSGWDTSNAESMQDMFEGCTSLSSVKLGENFSFKGGVGNTDWYAVLPNAPADEPCTGKWINESEQGAQGVSPEELQKYYPRAGDPSFSPGTYAWEGTQKVAVFDSKGGTLTFKREAGMYDNGDTDGTKTYYIGFEDNKYSNPGQVPWHDKRHDIEKVDFQATVAPKSCTLWFYDCLNLAEVQGADRLITSKVKDMNNMFSGCSSLASLDVSGWNTSKVKDMNNMFSGCTSLSGVTLGGDFSFKGDVSTPNWYAVLPDAPADIGHGGRWINESVPGASGVTAADLRDNYPSKSDPSFAPGTYRWEGHALTGTAEKKASCTEAGNSAYWFCSVCEKYFSDDAGTNKIEKDSWIIPATGHSMTRHNAVAPTCTKNGNVEYYACGICKKNFSDEQGNNEPDSIIDPKTGHKYGPWEKQNDKQHQKVCEHDKSHVIKENHKWDAGKVTKAATEQAEGVKTYTCTVCKATKTEAIPKLKTSGTPLAKAAVKKKSMTIGWSKIQGAEGYDIFFATCNHSGKKVARKNVKTIKGNKTFKWTKSGLRKGTPYKFYVRAYVTKNGKKTYVSKSPMMHAYTGNGTKYYTNAKSVTIKNVKKGKLSLSKGKTFKIKAKVNKVNKKKKLMPKGHAPALRYMTSNKKIATVNSSGKIKAKGKGTCSIYVYAHNGVSRSIKVTVK